MTSRIKPWLSVILCLAFVASGLPAKASPVYASSRATERVPDPSGAPLPPPPCALYPIALSDTSLEGKLPGDVIPDILNGVGPGNFGWLTWAGSPSEKALVTSLTPPGDSQTYVNPENADDHEVNIGDTVKGRPASPTAAPYAKRWISSRRSTLRSPCGAK